jgi:hypothetical protein
VAAVEDVDREEEEDGEVFVDDEDVSMDDFFPGGGCCMLKTGACKERCVVGCAEAKAGGWERVGVRSGFRLKDPCVLDICRYGERGAAARSGCTPVGVCRPGLHG